MIRRPPRPRRRRALLVVPLLVASAVLVPALATGPSARSTPTPPEVRRAFAATGGRIVAEVTVTGERHTPVELIDRSGTRLAAGVAGVVPLTLQGQAPRGDRVVVILRPSVKQGFSWQVAATGLVQPPDVLTTG